MKTKTFKDEWENFKKTVYTNGMTDEQHIQIHRAFYGGAVSFHKLLVALADSSLSDEETLHRTERLEMELKETVEDILNTIKARD